MLEAISENNPVPLPLRQLNTAVRWGTIAGARDPHVCGPMAGTDRPPRPVPPRFAESDPSRKLALACHDRSRIPHIDPQGLSLVLLPPEVQPVEFVDGDSPLALTPCGATFTGFLMLLLARHGVDVRLADANWQGAECTKKTIPLGWPAASSAVQQMVQQSGEKACLLQPLGWRPETLDDATVEALRQGQVIFCTAEDKRWWIFQHGRRVGRRLVESLVLVENQTATWDRFVYELIARILTRCTF